MTTSLYKGTEERTECKNIEALSCFRKIYPLILVYRVSLRVLLMVSKGSSDQGRVCRTNLHTKVNW